MITSVDTSVLLDVFGADTTFGPRSSDALRDALASGRLVGCDPVWAEVASFFSSAATASSAMQRLGVEFDALTEHAALAAGSAWSRYRARGGTRRRVVADFLVGAHALAQADRLLTRDHSFYRSYFRRLQIVDPAR